MIPYHRRWKYGRISFLQSQNSELLIFEPTIGVIKDFTGIYSDARCIVCDRDPVNFYSCICPSGSIRYHFLLCFALAGLLDRLIF